jgi:hypothetical protein
MNTFGIFSSGDDEKIFDFFDLLRLTTMNNKFVQTMIQNYWAINHTIQKDAPDDDDKKLNPRGQAHGKPRASPGQLSVLVIDCHGTKNG